MGFLGNVTAFAATVSANGGSTNDPVSIDLTFVVNILSFLVLVWLLWKFAWKPLSGMMLKRQKKIADNIDQAEKDRKEAEELKQSYEQEMLDTRKQAQEIIEQANKSTRERADAVLEAARKETEKKRAAALADLDKERERAVEGAKAQVVDMSVAVAEKLIRQKLDASGQKALIEQFIQEVGEKP